MEKVVGWLDQYHLGTILRGVAAATLFVVPAGQAYDDEVEPAWLAPVLTSFDDPRWLAPYFIAALVLVPLQHFKDGAPVSRVLRRLARVNGSFAGSLVSLGDDLRAARGRRLHDSECKSLCMGLLHRIRDYVAFSMGCGETPRLRATLSVPYCTEPGGPVDALRTWCYDESHLDRNYRIVHLPRGCEPPQQGAPAVYQGQEFDIINDIHQLPLPAGAPRPAYRSVLSLPVGIRDEAGNPLAVVNIDADEPNFFRADDVLQRVRPVVSPALNVIGLALLSRRRHGATYEFPR